MPRKSKRSYKFVKKLGPTLLRQPVIILAAAVPVVFLVAWLSGGFTHRIDQATEPSSLTGVQTLPQTPVAVAPPPSELLWKGPIQPVIIPLGASPVLYRLPITQPVVFLGIDDGWAKPADAQLWLISHQLPFTLFLTDDAIKNDYGYFQKLQSAGMTIEDHTLHHSRLTKLTPAQQRMEICSAADKYAKVFGRRPALFRPPYGLLNDSTAQAANGCGMRAIIMWRADVENDAINFQQGDRLQSGDIVLMHFHKGLAADLQVFINQVQHDHMQIGRLEDWLQ